jgi:hypothetical protein
MENSINLALKPQNRGNFSLRVKRKETFHTLHQYTVKEVSLNYEKRENRKIFELQTPHSHARGGVKGAKRFLQTVLLP